MNITITNTSGEDEWDKSICFVIVVQTDTHKTTAEFWDYADTFVSFAKALLAFPFDSKKPITYGTGDYFDGAGSFNLSVALANSLGAITMTVQTQDYAKNSARFRDDSVETEALHRLAHAVARH